MYVLFLSFFFLIVTAYISFYYLILFDCLLALFKNEEEAARFISILYGVSNDQVFSNFSSVYFSLLKLCTKTKTPAKKKWILFYK